MAVKSLARSGLITFDKYSSMLAGNAAFDPSSDWLLEEQVLTSTTASITFSNLSQYASEYQHLQIRSVAKASSTVNDYWAIGARYNGDTANNYYHHQLLANGSTVSSAANSLSYVYAGLVNNNYSTNGFGVGIFDLLDPFETTKKKTSRALMGVLGGQNRLFFTSGLWLNEAALTSITLIHGNGDSFIAGSRFSLYGVK